MKPTQNNKGGGPRWQEPDPGSAQKFITPEAEKSMREGAGRYRVVKADTSQRPKKKSPAASAPKPQKPPSLWGAVKAELGERFGVVGFGVTINSEDIIKGCIIAAYMVLFALMQTTFFARLAPFGAVPDLMMAMTAAVAQSEGEKWGGVCGLIAAIVIQSLGGIGTFPHLLPLLYVPIGYVIGILASYYFNSSLPIRGVYILGCGVIKMIFTGVTAALRLDASAAQIIGDIVIPEFFSTALLTPIVYFLMYISTKPFHKTRAERTEGSPNKN